MLFSLAPAPKPGDSPDSGLLGCDAFIQRAQEQAASAIQRTRLCRYYAKGCCNKGVACPFAHGQQELVERPDLTKTSMCRAWRTGLSCAYGDECLFAHGSQELRVVRSDGSARPLAPNSQRAGFCPGGWHGDKVRASISGRTSCATAFDVKASRLTHSSAKFVPAVNLTTYAYHGTSSVESLSNISVGVPGDYLASTLPVEDHPCGLSACDTTNERGQFPQLLRRRKDAIDLAFADAPDENRSMRRTRGGLLDRKGAGSVDMVGGKQVVACFSV